MTRKLFKNAIFIDLHRHLSSSGPSNSENQLNIYNYMANDSTKKSFNTEDVEFFSVGIHPWYLREFDEKYFKKVQQLGCNEKCLFIGEAGLDRMKGPKLDIQTKVFIKHIELSEKLSKPLIIHNVKCISDILELRKVSKATMPWILHDFNENQEVIKQCLKQNFYFSLGATFFSKSNSTIRKSLKYIPISNLFLETDEAEFKIEDNYILLASCLDMNLDDLVKQIKENFLSITNFHDDEDDL